MGIIHKDPQTLVNEIKAYLADPNGWMENDARKKAMEDFCQKYALVDTKWHKKWKKVINENFSAGITK